MAPRPRVLLVDDAPEMRALLALQLAGLGCDCELASNEDEALACMTRAPVLDLVLADVHLAPGPAASGSALPARLRAAGYRGRMVTMSAGPAPGATYADGHLPKPITREQLAACVRAGLPPEAWSVPPPVSRLSEELAMRPLLDAYVVLLDGRARELDTLTRRGDVTGLGRVLHALEGSAGSYGFDEITEMARVAGDPLRAGAAVADVLPALSRLQKLCARARAA